MKPSKHTPGPWYEENFDVFRPEEHGIKAAGFPLASVHSYNNPEETAANARLIAAAPYLLKALTYLIAAAPKLRVACEFVRAHECNQMPCPECYEKVRAAIAQTKQ